MIAHSSRRRIEPQSRLAFPSPAELWEWREFTWLLISRDLRSRYTQTLIGIAWAILNPLFLAAIYTVFIGIVLNAPSEGIPSPLYIFSGVIIWRLFSQSVRRGSASLRTNRNLLTNQYFPKLTLLIATVATELVDFSLGLVILTVFILLFGIFPPASLLLVPLLGLLVSLVGLCLAAWFAPLHAKYHDMDHITPLLLQAGFYASAVLYPATLIPDRFQVLLRINPMVNLVEVGRWLMFRSVPTPDFVMLVISLAITLVLFLAALLSFNSRSDQIIEDL